MTDNKELSPLAKQIREIILNHSPDKAAELITEMIDENVSETMKPMDEDYPLIPMREITDEARRIAVRWMECDDKKFIAQKHKLASDIMNYARRHRTNTPKEPKQ